MNRTRFNFAAGYVFRAISGRIASTFFVVLTFLYAGAPLSAASSSPRLAAYYDRKMVLCDKTAFQWQGYDKPRRVADNIAQVGVGRDVSYALTHDGRLLSWRASAESPRVILERISWFAAGRSGVFAIRTDNTLMFLERSDSWFGVGNMAKPVEIADQVKTASIGDGANYYVTQAGVLFVKGLSHRGQYGDGKLQSTTDFVAVANNVVSIKAHTGHAILLAENGTVMGTGGNIYGPLGQHGLGDKATSWGVIFRDAIAIATGSSHSLAIKSDGSLWSWGRDIGLVPKLVLNEVVAVAADLTGSIALLSDNTLWQWDRGKQPTLHFRCS